jgi:competence protein ComEC
MLLVGCGGAQPVAPPRPAPALPGDLGGGPAAKTPDGAAPKPAEPPTPAGGGAPSDAGDLGDLLGKTEGPTLLAHFISVGQGDAALLQSPGGKNVLIDAGPPEGVPALLRYLGDRQVHQIDLLVETHPHADHIGGVAAVVGAVTVSQVLVSGFVHPTPIYDEMLAALEKDKIPVKIARRGRTITVEDGFTMQVLAPEEPLINGSRSDANANSVVLLVDFHGMRFLFTGDAESETEDRLLQGERDALHATVLKVAHHGSRYATGDAFLDAVHPRIAVISCAKKNRYGHPAPETVDRLRGRHIALLQTQVDGSVMMATDGRHIDIYTIPQGGGAFGGAKRWGPHADDEPLQATAPRGPPAHGKAKDKDVGEGGTINVNTASLEELVKLPGVGKATAGRILEWRQEHGPFASVDDLRNVKGIGAKTLEKLRDHVVLTGAGSAAPDAPAAPKGAPAAPKGAPADDAPPADDGGDLNN